MGQNRRQQIKIQRKKQSVLRHIEQGNQTTINETEKIVDSVASSDQGKSPVAAPSLKAVLRDVIKPSTSKWANDTTKPIQVAPDLKPQAQSEVLAPEVEKRNAKLGPAPKAKGNAIGNFQKNLRGMVKEKLEDSALGQIVDSFKNVRDEIKDMTLSDEQRAEKELAEKIKLDKEESLKKAKENKMQWDALERLREKGMSDEDFKKYSKEIFASQKLTAGKTGAGGTDSTLEEDIRAMREALEKSIEFAKDGAEAARQVEKETKQEQAEHNREVEKVREEQQKEVIDELKSIDGHTADAAKLAEAKAKSDDTGGGSFKDKLKKKLLGKALDFAKKKVPGVGSMIEKGKGLFGKTPIPTTGGIAGEAASGASALETAASGAGTAAKGAGLLGTLGASVGSLGAGTAALGATAAGALGYGAGTLLYNNSETVRDAAGSAMEGIFGHIKTPDEMEKERQASPEYQASMARIAKVKADRARAAEVAKVEPTTKSDTLEKQDASSQAVQDLGRQKNIANAADEKISKLNAQEAAVKPKTEDASKDKSTIIVSSGGGQSSAPNIITPRSQENTLQRLQERMFRGAMV